MLILNEGKSQVGEEQAFATALQKQDRSSCNRFLRLSRRNNREFELVDTDVAVDGPTAEARVEFELEGKTESSNLDLAKPSGDHWRVVLTTTAD
ncbi:MAG: hypothetical protein ACRDMA_13005 [Solirubrobacterales bacterium]